MTERPSGFLSVMADRQPDPGGLDYFPTPPWAARAGAELIKRIDPEGRTCWEPAAGGGHMAHGLRDYFEQVTESDIQDYGRQILVGDFLAGDVSGQFDWIVTNPPFNLAAPFVRTAWERARRGVAMLCRLSFLEGVGRYKLLYQDCPIYAVAPFAERVPMVKGRWDPQASTATAYAWFLWRKPMPAFVPPTAAVMPIAPGAKERLTRRSDLERFVASSAPLLEGRDG